MRIRPSPVRQRYLAPEVIQASAMDCGPAALKCLLEGFGIPVSYGRLREACQTDVDGTSIDTIEEVGNLLGLEAEQVMIPLDHLLLPEAQALPALVVVASPGGFTHFVVAWRRHGSRLQLMDPATGRRWPAADRFLSDIYLHALPVEAAAWRAWAESPEFLSPLKARLAALGIGRREIGRLVADAASDPGWRSFAALDAATRLTALLTHSGGLRSGVEAAGVLGSLVDRAREGVLEAIPESYWTVRPIPGDDENVTLRGAVLLRVKGRSSAPEAALPESASRELRQAIEEIPERPLVEIFRALRADGLLAPGILVGGFFLAALGVLLEALLLRGFLDLGGQLGLGLQRLTAVGALLACLALLLLMAGPLAQGQLRLGRRLESRFRLAFLEKLPRLGDRYFRSRLISDMAERCHNLHLLRGLPLLGGDLVRSFFDLALTTAGILWLDPGSARLVIPTALAAVCIPFLAQPALVEKDLKLRSHAGALTRYYLDAFLGLIPIRTHGAERVMRREHEQLLVEWVRAGLERQRAAVAVETVLSASGFLLTAWLLFDHLERQGSVGGALLFLYWALSLPGIGRSMGLTAREYLAYRSVILRASEPLRAPEEFAFARPTGEEAPASGPGAGAPRRGIALSLREVTVRASGHTVLQGIDLEIEAGEQVAIVGPSGAGKSSLVGLFLGWHPAAEGEVLADGRRLDAGRLQWLRQRTAWVDPAVQLWNRSLFDNLIYGASDAPLPLSRAIDGADLRSLLEELPQGLQTPLGEGGALLSGGQGQRVRLGRALLRPDIGLAILDEPFRGLDGGQRHDLLARARELWQGATLLLVTHDIGETRGFQRVIVVQDGRLAEQGEPEELARRPGSLYRAMLDTEERLKARLREPAWRQLHLKAGRLDGGDRSGPPKP